MYMLKYGITYIQKKGEEKVIQTKLRLLVYKSPTFYAVSIHSYTRGYLVYLGTKMTLKGELRVGWSGLHSLAVTVMMVTL